ncbi:MAG: 4-(cytidine 5'-diphospho)-2-C-methyl-D-erythritol kinase [Acidimicrobiales bacterium]|nr:4-(cytidine 5'-diphospho)-2-C-methyl-D-erythritol kinase [Acidimicrobiales bacterium]MDG1845263.1 4-(cytidine 5'-diphospho)-2-C-methyl-D-erythritol kinase [Acidimicrobiales bacterium]
MELISPAKLTLSLKITGRREDGFHLLEAEMVTIDFVDIVTVQDGPRKVIYEGQYPIDPDPDDDIVFRAMEFLKYDATVTIQKNIPPGGGLGGGSGNAATILRMMNFDDAERTVELGADVPFNLRGGRALVQGIGEILTPCSFEEKEFTLMIPPFGCSTIAVYERWDALGGPVNPRGNDLEAAALDIEPRLAIWRSKLEKHTGQQPKLAGSGSTWFVEGSYPGNGFITARSLPASE